MITNLQTIKSVDLGRQGENEALTLVFDLSEIIAEFGSGGTASLIHLRPGETKPYVAASSTDSTLSWQVTDADTYYSGIGSAEVRYVLDDVLKKSCKFSTIIHAGLMDADEEKPGAVVYMTDVSGYVKAVEDLKEEVESYDDQFTALKTEIVDVIGLDETTFFSDVSDWEQGAIVDGKKESNTTRVRTVNPILVPKGYTLKCETSNWGLFSVFDIDMNYLEATSWTNSHFRYTTTQDSYVYCVVRKGNSSAITPDEADATVCRLSMTQAEVASINDDVDAEKRLSGTVDMGIVQGGIDGSSGSALITVNAKRVRSGVIKFLKGDKIKITPNGQYIYLYYVKSDKVTIISYVAWSKADYETTLEDDSYIVFMVKMASDDTITPEECTVTVEVTRPYDLVSIDSKEYLDEYVKPAIVAEVTPLTSADFEQGTFDSSGEKMTATTRLRTINKHFVQKGYKVRIVTHGYYIYWYAYDLTGAMVDSSGSWSTFNQDFTFSEDRYINFIFTKTYGSDVITPDDYAADIEIVSTVADYLSTYRSTNEYSGEQIRIGKHRYSYENDFALTEKQSYHNGVAIYGDEVFMEINNGAMEVHSISTGLKISSFTLPGIGDNHHGNTILFEPFVRSGEQYPYLYTDDHYTPFNIYVHRITKSGTTYTAELVQTITMGTLPASITGAGMNDFAIDFYNSKLYLFFYTLNTFQPEEGNYQIVSVYNLPDVSTSTVALSESDVLDTWTLEKLYYARQQIVFSDGRIYFLHGTSGDQSIDVIDPYRKLVVASVDTVTITGGKEPEGLVIDTDKILLFVNGLPNTIALRF